MKILHWPFLFLFIIGSSLGTIRPPGAVENPALIQVSKALVILGNDTVNAEVARTSQERSKGLMDRIEVPDGTGMLFVFEREANRTFWMQDTLISLDIAFLDSSMTIIDIQHMESGSGKAISKLIKVSCIQNVLLASLSNTNNIPVPSGTSILSISPLLRSCDVLATSALTVSFPRITKALLT
jgi:uncharacterized membrane protein (UPF0127 family)